MPKFNLPNSEFKILISFETLKDIQTLLNTIGYGFNYDFVCDEYLIWDGVKLLAAKLGDTIVYEDNVVSIESAVDANRRSGGDPCA